MAKLERIPKRTPMLLPVPSLDAVDLKMALDSRITALGIGPRVADTIGYVMTEVNGILSRSPAKFQTEGFIFTSEWKKQDTLFCIDLKDGEKKEFHPDILKPYLRYFFDSLREYEYLNELKRTLSFPTDKLDLLSSLVQQRQATASLGFRMDTDPSQAVSAYFDDMNVYVPHMFYQKTTNKDQTSLSHIGILLKENTKQLQEEKKTEKCVGLAYERALWKAIYTGMNLGIITEGRQQFSSY